LTSSLCTLATMRIAGPVLWLLALFGVGCTSSSGAGPGAGGGGNRDAGVTREGGRSCSPIPSGCLCVFGEDDDPGPLATCDPTSVIQSAGGAEQGVCCEEEVFCGCDAYVCRNDQARQYCQCGTTFSVSTAVQGSPVFECPPIIPVEEQKCCLSVENRTCICSVLPCDENAVGVATCSLAEIAVCYPAAPRVVSACR